VDASLLARSEPAFIFEPINLADNPKPWMRASARLGANRPGPGESVRPNPLCRAHPVTWRKTPKAWMSLKPKWSRETRRS